MKRRYSGYACALVLWACICHADVADRAAPPDLTGFIPVLTERFDAGLNTYDGKQGVWSTLPRRGRLMTNARKTVMLGPDILGIDADILPEVHVVTTDGLSLRTLPLSPAARNAVTGYMTRTGQGDRAAPVRYGAGQITTAQTWAQRYGYFEIRARIPRGVGRWPAFWMTFAGQGWPPEIDVMEAYGAGIDRPGPRDGLFNTAVFFDARDESGAEVHETPGINLLAPDAESRVAKRRMSRGEPVFNFVRKIDSTTLGADIYDAVWTYAVLWTPETITFFFGKDRASLRAVYSVPTPDDVHVPMYVIANDQFTTQGGWWEPRAEQREQVTRPENDFLVEEITLMALPPDCQRAASDRPDPTVYCVVTRVDGSSRDEFIVTGAGFELVKLGGGANQVYVRRGPEMKLLEGFGSDDRLVLEGYPFTDAQDVLSRLTQVGRDVWLSAGADPFWPNTIVFRNAAPAMFNAAQFDIRWPVGRDTWAADPMHRGGPDPAPSGGEPIIASPEGSWLSDRGEQRWLVGGAGPDRFVVANPQTTVEEPPQGGLDTLIADASARVPCHVERAIARASGIRLEGSPCAERLEAEASDVTLVPGQGDDLVVIGNGLRNVRFGLGARDGNDRVRGIDPDLGHHLALDAAISTKKDSWQIEEAPDGWSVIFTPSVSLLIEDVDRAMVDALLASAR